jgi:hypothetical protein
MTASQASPEDAQRCFTVAEHLHESGDAAAAVRVLAPALRRRPDWAAGHNLMGMALFDAGRYDAAIAAFRCAAAFAPTAAAPFANLGMALKTVGRFDDAIAAHDAAVARDPADPQLRLNRAVARLRAGRMAEAWDDYECRHALPGHAIPLPLDRLLPAPLPDLAGRTVLTLHEEGFGDTIQFARYLPLLAARGTNVLVRVPADLVRLFAGNPALGRVLDPAAPLPAYDFHCPFFSLPRAFATTLETIPAEIPYLHADPALVAAWRERLPEANGRRRIGLVWAGQARPWLPGFTALDHRRSTTLAAFAPLAALADVTFVSLQKGPAAAEAAAPPPGMALHDPMDAVADFADTAAIIAGLDAVVSVDTSVVHLAGALGRPVLLLDRYDGCWRWLAGRDDSPWYPTLRILRQPRPGDWADVLRRAAAALASAGRE